MSLPFKPHIIALLCSAGLLAAAGTLYVQSRTPATIAEPPAQQAPAPAASTTQPVAATYTRAQIDQWVAPIALPGQSAVAGVDGLHLSRQRPAGGPVVPWITPR